MEGGGRQGWRFNGLWFASRFLSWAARRAGAARTSAAGQPQACMQARTAPPLSRHHSYPPLATRFDYFWTASQIYFLIDTIFVGEPAPRPPARLPRPCSCESPRQPASGRTGRLGAPASPAGRSSRAAASTHAPTPAGRAARARAKPRPAPAAAAPPVRTLPRSEPPHPRCPLPPQGIYPQSVKSPVVILCHHLCTSLYMLIPYYYPHYHW